MAWRVADPASAQEMVLVLPRVQPADRAALELWQQAMAQAARLSHPQLAAVLDHGVHGGWPYAAYDPLADATLAERLPAGGLPGSEAAGLVRQVLQGLAFAHEAGVAHHDLQPYLLMVSDSGQLRVAGLSVAVEMAARRAAAAAGGEASARQGRQAASERGLPGHVITLSRSLVVPFLSFSQRRDLRESAWRAWVGRGEHPGERSSRSAPASPSPETWCSRCRMCPDCSPPSTPPARRSASST